MRVRRPAVARACRVLVGLLALSAAPLRGQSVKPLRGVVFDSLARKPLADATVRVEGASAFAVTDGKGRFHFDSLPTGVVSLAVEHPMLDSIGLYALSARVTHDGKREQRLGVPSLATLARAICGRAVTGDSAIVYGTLLTTDSRPADRAALRLEWLRVAKVGESSLQSQRIAYETQADSLGRFAACGLPYDEPITLYARGAGRDSTRALTLAVPAQHARVLRQELMLALAPVVSATSSDTATADSAAVQLRPQPPAGPRGTVRGTVQGAAGEPIANAIVYVGELPEIRADSAGRFVARDVPVGSQQVEAFAIGRLPQARVANVRDGDTTRVALVLEKVTTLAAVRTRANTLDMAMLGLEERKRRGMGYIRDSTEVARYPSLNAAFNTVPSVTARTGRGGIPVVLFPALMGGQCQARLFVDGRPDSWDRVASMLTKDIAWMEMYPRPALVPFEFQGGSVMDCGVVHIMTKSRVAR